MNESMMLWANASKTTLSVSVAEAMSYYADKYGRAARVVLANARELDGAALVVAGVTVQASRTVIRGHLMLGMGEKA